MDKIGTIEDLSFDMLGIISSFSLFLRVLIIQTRTRLEELISLKIAITLMNLSQGIKMGS